MKPTPHRHHAAAKRKIRRRLDRPITAESPDPIITARDLEYEAATKTKAISRGGMGGIHPLVRKLGLTEAIDEHLHPLESHFPYHESDHVLNLASDALRHGPRLDDLEPRRDDLVFLDAPGADRLPDPTTAGDFRRRPSTDDVETLQDVFDRTRLEVWRERPADSFDGAILDGDGTPVPTGACREQGVDIAYDGAWGYRPPIVSPAHAGAVIGLVNRPGDRPSHEGAAEPLDLAVPLRREAGFRRISLRGDTDFTQTKQLDAWDAGRVTSLVGIDAMPNLKALAEDLTTSAWSGPRRPLQYKSRGPARKRPEGVEDRIVRQREFETLTRIAEDVAGVEYRPTARRRTCRPIVARQTIAVERGRARPFDEIRHRFHSSDDRKAAARESVFKANDRRDQEDLGARLKGGGRAARAAVDDLVSDRAYMVMTGPGWDLEAWFAPQVPEHPRHEEQHRDQKRRLLGMEFKRSVNTIVPMPCPIVRGGRRPVYRLLSWNEWRGVSPRTIHASRRRRAPTRSRDADVPVRRGISSHEADGG